MSARLVPVIVAIGSLAIGQLQQTIEERVKRNPTLTSVDVVINREFSPVSLTEVIAASDVIVHGYVRAAESKLSDDGRSIVTHVSIQVLDTVKRSVGLLGTTVILKRPGGSVVVLGKEVRATESDFPPLVIGDEYIIFMKANPKSELFDLPYGAQSAFDVREGYVLQVSKSFGVWNQEHGRTKYSDFAEIVRREMQGK